MPASHLVKFTACLIHFQKLSEQNPRTKSECGVSHLKLTGFSASKVGKDLEGDYANTISKYDGVSKSIRTGLLEQELQMVQLSAIRCSCIAIL
jgi:hypothetical protein